MSDTHKQHRTILTYAYVMAAVGAVAAMLLIISMQLVHSREAVSRNLLEQYHMRSLMLVEEIEVQLSYLGATTIVSRGATTAGLNLASPVVTSTQEITPIFESTRELLLSITSLQVEYGDELFADTVQRARQRCDYICQKLQAGTWPLASFIDRLKGFALAIDQLERLHTIAVNDALHAISINNRQRMLSVVLIVGIILVTAGAFTLRLLVLLHRQLRLHLQTEEEFLDSERKLQHTQKLDALGTLVGGIAHDFNNVLTVILGHTEALIARVPSGDSIYSDLPHIQKAGQRAADLTRQLLAFSRNDTLKPRVVDLDLLIGGIEPFLRRLTREDISLIIESDGDAACIRADAVQMEQVLMNLVVNSRDAMPDGGQLVILTSCIELGAERAAKLDVSPCAYCCISVEDNGFGMTQEVCSRAFEPFYTTKERGRGTGLGLSTVHGIVTKSQGFIELDSEVARGTRVEIYLPRYDKKSNKELVDTHLQIAENLGGTETILVVEDEKQVRDLVSSALHTAGYHVLPASNGSEALQICRAYRRPLHLILTDVVMPGMQGPDMVTQVRRLFPDAGVIYMSGYSDKTILKSIRRAGDPLVSKPFKLKRLLRIIRRELNGCRKEQVSATCLQ